MNDKPKIGLLPLYLELYDKSRPESRAGYDGFLADVVGEFETREIEVVRADICRVAAEFEAAVKSFDDAEVDCIVTLHLAYSPSLESIDALAGTDRALLILDTTMDADFGQDTDPARIMYNHGIHGVMDLACMLRRRGRDYTIVAGHVTESDVMDRAAETARAAFAARCFRNTRALRIGEAFKGMGDFHVAEKTLKRVLGIRVEQTDAGELAETAIGIGEEEIKRELNEDSKRYVCKLPRDVHERSVRSGLALGRKLEAGGYTAFSMNFLAFDKPDGPVVPFLEACKAMSRGIGYAGEGDVLTAALVGALQRGFGETTFTEIFCPDWNGDTLFLSHMGEINPDVAAGKPELVEKDFPWTRAQSPAALGCAPRPGPAVFVNLAPGPDDSFTLIVAPVEVLEDTEREDMRDSVRGWIKPACGVAAFLEKYSQLGGTHHSALVLGDRLEAVKAFGRYAGLECLVIE